ncbi:MAG: helix-turn-helix transcriptional regulator [Candidatus Aminicenantes bacterium]|nr:helix-turn-helix transcriptional regulator [Candidatus Aminicenantes bacterium]
MGYGLLAGAYLAAAAGLILAGLRLLRRRPSPAMRSYAIFLALWVSQNVFALAFLLYSGVLPKAGRLGFIFFNALVLIPVQAATAIAFIAFLGHLTCRWKLRGAAGPVLSAPFLIIMIFYAQKAFQRMAENPSPSSFQIRAPLSGNIMLGLILVSAGAVFILGISGKSPRWGKTPAVVAGLTSVGVIVLIPAMRISTTPPVGFILSGFVWLAAHVPAFLALAVMFRKERRVAAEATSFKPGVAEIAGRYGLSERETQILASVMRGRLNKEIAAELFVSPDTVKKHLYNIFKKTSVRSRLQLFLLVQGAESRESRDKTSP